MHQPVQHSTAVRSAHTVFMCFVFIWEQTATCATYSINWLVFITETKCLQRGTDWVFKWSGLHLVFKGIIIIIIIINGAAYCVLKGYSVLWLLVVRTFWSPNRCFCTEIHSEFRTKFQQSQIITNCVTRMYAHNLESFATMPIL